MTVEEMMIKVVVVAEELAIDVMKERDLNEEA